MIISDYEYFTGRADQEDDAARSATCIEGRICHQNLADAYRRRCEDIFASTVHNASATPAGYPTTTRQPLVISNTPALTASPAAAPRLVVKDRLHHGFRGRRVNA